MLTVGSPAPDVVLTNQLAEVVDLATLRETRVRKLLEMVGK